MPVVVEWVKQRASLDIERRKKEIVLIENTIETQKSSADAQEKMAASQVASAKALDAIREHTEEDLRYARHAHKALGEIKDGIGDVKRVLKRNGPQGD